MTSLGQALSTANASERQISGNAAQDSSEFPVAEKAGHALL